MTTATQIIQEELVKLQPKGLITIPKRFRVAFAFEDNSIIRIKKDKGRLVLEPVRTLPYPVRSYSKQEIKEFIELDTDQTKRLKRKKLLK